MFSLPFMSLWRRHWCWINGYCEMFEGISQFIEYAFNSKAGIPHSLICYCEFSFWVDVSFCRWVSYSYWISTQEKTLPNLHQISYYLDLHMSFLWCFDHSCTVGALTYDNRSWFLLVSKGPVILKAFQCHKGIMARFDVFYDQWPDITSIHWVHS